jgi:hypothetical protein
MQRPLTYPCKQCHVEFPVPEFGCWQSFCPSCIEVITMAAEKREKQCRVCTEPKIQDSFYCEQCTIRLKYDRKTEGWSRSSYLADKEAYGS